MLRRVAYSMLAGCVLSSLAACGSLFDVETREPWRAEVEAACLASGEVHETAGIRLTRAVEGPGACGVDRPFAVSALEAGPPLAFAAMSMPGGALLPPASVGQAAQSGDGLEQGAAIGDGYQTLPDSPAELPAQAAPPPPGLPDADDVATARLEDAPDFVAIG